MAPNLSSNRNELGRTEHLAKSAKLLTVYFAKWKLIFPTHEVSKAQLAVYLEALGELSLGELEDGCREVVKTVVTFPKPAEIIAASRASCEDPLSGPRLPEYPEVTPEERKSADEITAEFKRRMGWDNPKPAKATEKKPLTIVGPTRSLEQQKEILQARGFLPILFANGQHSPKCLCADCRKRRERI